MRTLNIFEDKKEEEYIQFAQCMNTEGFWTCADTSILKSKCVLLDYRSSIYDYYLCQEYDGEHFLYRSKK